MHGKRFDEDELELVVHGKLVHGAWRELHVQLHMDGQVQGEVLVGADIDMAADYGKGSPCEGVHGERQ